VTKVAAREVKTKIEVEGMPQLRLPDSESTAEIVISQALRFCAQKMGLANHQVAAERLQQGDRNACKYCHYSVAKQVAESLGALDRKIKAVYVADYDATPQDICFSEVFHVFFSSQLCRVSAPSCVRNCLVPRNRSSAGATCFEAVAPSSFFTHGINS